MPDDPLENQLPELEASPKPAPETLHALTIASLCLAVLSSSPGLQKTSPKIRLRSLTRPSGDKRTGMLRPRLTSIMIGISFLGRQRTDNRDLRLAFSFHLSPMATRNAVAGNHNSRSPGTRPHSEVRLSSSAAHSSLPPTYSFPSGHSLFSFCFYGELAGLSGGPIRSPLLFD